MQWLSVLLFVVAQISAIVAVDLSEECSPLVMDPYFRNAIQSRHKKSYPQKYDCELEQMAAGFQRVAYKVRDGYGWIMVQGKGRDLDEKLDSAFKRPDWDKMKNARDKPARYGCYIDYDSAVMTCVYDKMI